MGVDGICGSAIDHKQDSVGGGYLGPGALNTNFLYSI